MELTEIRNIHNHLDTNTCNDLVCALVLTHLEYANGILSGVSDSVIDILQKVQNFAANIVLRKFKYDSSHECIK